MKAIQSLLISSGFMVLTGCQPVDQTTGGETNPATQEQTIVIDFSPATLAGGSRCANAPFSREGYIFDPVKSCGFSVANNDATENVWLSIPYSGGTPTLYAPNKQKFTIYQMDIGEYSTVFANQQTLKVACVTDGTPTYVDIELDGIITDSSDKFQTFNMKESCSNIDEFWFDTTMSVDNIKISKITP